MSHMENLISLVEEVATFYDLDKDALLNQNQEFHYVDIGTCFLKVHNKTFYTECIVCEKNNYLKYHKIASLFKAVQVLKSFILYDAKLEN